MESTPVRGNEKDSHRRRDAMLIKCFTVGAYETNCYIVTDEKTLESAVIDPGAEGTTILDYLEDNHLTCACILLTHGHFDHTGAVAALMQETGAPLYVSQKDDGVTIGGEYYRYRAPEGAHFISGGDTVSVGALRFTVLETPGHTPGSVCFLCEEQGTEEKALFSGDTLFRDSCGRTDFPGSSGEAMLKSLRKLWELPGDWEVYPGHMGATTLNRERQANYFMLQAADAT